ncbi:MAG: hypothetical protein EKK40_07075 [Bradyrhizobiaceae bacterium]|nr:MAG: hypothetical protein EKK40_07075 [Bradyrhizobiaceae bacterium]
MDISNEELYQTALSDEQPEQNAVDVTANDQVDPGQQPRDESGRFAPKPEATEQEAKPVKAEQPTEAMVPSWRLREKSDEIEGLRSQLARLQSQLPQAPKQPAQKPDPFENPDGFVRANVSEAVDPIKAEVNGIKEQFSLMYAIDKFGEEKVNSAFQALHQAAMRGDTEASATISRVKQSMTPYQDIVKWHEKQAVFSEIGGDPQAWFAKQLEEKLKDDKFKSELAGKLNPQQEKPKPVFNVPPSLNRAASAAAALDEAGDLSNESLFITALS